MPDLPEKTHLPEYESAPVIHVATGEQRDRFANLMAARDGMFWTSVDSAEGIRLAREGWQEIIDIQLREWLRDPSQLEDDGIDAPTKTTLRLAIDLAEQCRDDEFASPDRVVRDPNGGIVFEHRTPDGTEAFHIWDDGTVDYRRFQGPELVCRTGV